MNQETLKGGISYNKYVWVTNEGACEKCQELNGKTFDSIDDIPDKPHPNCKCYVDIVEDDKSGQDEPCNCWEKAEKILDDTHEKFGETTTLLDECKEYIDDVNRKIQEV